MLRKLKEKIAKTVSTQHYEGIGNFLYMTQNYDRAKSYLIQAAQKGSPSALYRLYQIANEQKDLAKANYYLGMYYERTQQSAAALKAYQKASDAGHVKSLYKIGELHYQAGNKELAFSCYEQAAHQYSPHALNKLKLLTEVGQDQEKANWIYATLYEQGYFGGDETERRIKAAEHYGAAMKWAKQTDMKYIHALEKYENVWSDDTRFILANRYPDISKELKLFSDLVNKEFLGMYNLRKVDAKYIIKEGERGRLKTLAIVSKDNINYWINLKPLYALELGRLHETESNNYECIGIDDPLYDEYNIVCNYLKREAISYYLKSAKQGHKESLDCIEKILAKYPPYFEELHPTNIFHFKTVLTGASILELAIVYRDVYKDLNSAIYYLSWFKIPILKSYFDIAYNIYHRGLEELGKTLKINADSYYELGKVYATKGLYYKSANRVGALNDKLREDYQTKEIKCYLEGAQNGSKKALNALKEKYKQVQLSNEQKFTLAEICRDYYNDIITALDIFLSISNGFWEEKDGNYRDKATQAIAAMTEKDANSAYQFATYYNDKDKNKAIEYYFIAAKKGDVKSRLALEDKHLKNELNEEQELALNQLLMASESDKSSALIYYRWLLEKNNETTHQAMYKLVVHNPMLAYELANLFASNETVTITATAFPYYLLAAAKGHTLALQAVKPLIKDIKIDQLAHPFAHMLAQIFYQYWQDEATALAIYKKLADEDYAPAQKALDEIIKLNVQLAFTLGKLYINEKACSVQYKKAINYLLRAANAGMKDALDLINEHINSMDLDQRLQLAKLYLEKYNDKSAAIEHFKWLVDRNHSLATAELNTLLTSDSECAYDLALCYECEIDNNKQEKCYHYYAIAARGGHQLAFAHITGFADNNIPAAQFALSSEYYYRKQDYIQTIEWCLKAINQGYQPAKTFLLHTAFSPEVLLLIANYYKTGEMIKANDKDMLYFYEKAHAAGSAEAGLQLGYYYLLEHHDSTKNPIKAFNYLFQAANDKHSDAIFSLEALSEEDSISADMQCSLADLFQHNDFYNNKIKALHWYEVASLNGSEKATQKLRDLYPSFNNTRFSLFAQATKEEGEVMQANDTYVEYKGNGY